MRPWQSILLAAVMMAGCDDQQPRRLDVVFMPAQRAVSRAAIAGEGVAVSPTPTVGSSAPAGYLVVTPVARSSELGTAILLLHPSEDIVVPIYIGGTEALSIQLRMEQKKFTRPLTHDLMDTMVERLGAKMLRAQVNALKDGVFLGSVVFDDAGTLIEIDARPSDAIALAIGNQVPIFIAPEVIADAGVRPETVSGVRPHSKTPPVAL